jgi:inosine/xanthosine triphosphate pyrophosphatase family protein
VKPRPHRRITGRLVIATHNSGKLAEMRELLAPYEIEAISAGEMGLHEPDESGTSFRANARIKAVAAAKASGLPAFADDSGLAVDALAGAPGIYSARWAGPGRDFHIAMEMVERKLRCAGAAQSALRFRVVCRLAGRARRGIRSLRRRRDRLAAARRQGLRLRSDLLAGWASPHLRRNAKR